MALPWTDLRLLSEELDKVQIDIYHHVITKVSWRKYISRIHSNQWMWQVRSGWVMSEWSSKAKREDHAYPFFLSRSSSMDPTLLRAVEGPRRRPGWRRFKESIIMRIMEPSMALK